MTAMYQSDLDLAVFLATRQAFKVQRERPKPTARERERRRYDRETEEKLMFIRGQQVAELTRSMGRAS